MGPLLIDELISIATTPYPPTLSQSATPNTSSPQAPGVAGVDGEQPELLSVSKESLTAPIQRINEAFRPRGLEFELSEQSGRVITKVIDRETGDVIRQIPAEEVLLVAERLGELQGRIISLEA
ncbi:flagellar protein FlaG [Vreelandella venusta]|uniref:Flagellar protein n=1 Tax=Vreelandella venusta TaxID=44935 RepID=A0AAP9ZD83_9GAMM|nr:flagellar protein FlaG [Halomonas venusta]MBR9924502.1 flagellar protein FlaG [Gammaproteobacteria bacterium]AZM94259.1 flagellar protein FlaG [Halomonas venusta]MDW0359179.1 flagellar protein FlaG [Halomonas venusta]MDX1354000.1 flagellar protein FlaG [Halomonas venusta]MDX1712809.1 flagellar protein FlaG [Halomonas venusta]